MVARDVSALICNVIVNLSIARLAGYPPFSDEIKEYSLHDQITQGRYTFHTDYWKDVSKEAMDLVKQLLTVCPEDRLTIEGVLSHPWMQDPPVISRARCLMDESSESSTTQFCLKDESAVSSTTCLKEESAISSTTPSSVSAGQQRSGNVQPQ